MPQDSVKLSQLVMAMLVLAFGGWSASIAYTGTNIARAVEKQREELADIRTQLALIQERTASSNTSSKVAIDVAAQHGEELDKIRTRILRLEAKH